VSIRPRTSAVILPILLAGPVLLAGCSGDDASEPTASSSSSAATQESPKESATESPDADATAAETGAPSGFPADIDPDTQQQSADAAVTVSDIRIGSHDGFDRVVFEVGGTGTPGWDVQYVDAATSQGKGDSVEVDGDAVLQVTLTGVGYPYDTQVEEYATRRLTEPGTPVVTEVVFDSTYEGTTLAFIGTEGKNPFRTYALENPTRVVVEISHSS
jgi:hypothetical protein